MKVRNLLFFLMLACSLLFALSACDSEGPAEKAGENIDQAAEQTGDAAEEAMNPVETMGEKLNQAAEQAGDAIENTVNQAKEKIGAIGDSAQPETHNEMGSNAEPETHN